MGPPTMKGLTLFVADLRGCASQQMEDKRVMTELGKIRSKFSGGTSISGYDRKKYVWKMVYCYMLGYDIDVVHMEIVRLLSSTKYSEKNCGYISCGLLLNGNGDIIRLITNLLKNDLLSTNPHIAALAFNCIANTLTEEAAEHLLQDVTKFLNPATGAQPYLKQKAAICTLKMYQKDTASLPPTIWVQRFQLILNGEKDTGFLTSLASLLLGVINGPDSALYAALAPNVLAALQRTIDGEIHPTYFFYSVPAPWLQVKLLRFLQKCPVPEGEYLEKVNSVIGNILDKVPLYQSVPVTNAPAKPKNKKKKKTEGSKLNRANTENAVLFEALSLGIYLEGGFDVEIKKKAAAVLGMFVVSREANVRYLGLETMSRMANDPDVDDTFKKHSNEIMKQLTEPDISIRRQALNLLFAICDKTNWGYIVDELLERLKTADVLLQEELVLKIAILVEINAPDFTWYVDVVFKMIEYAPDCVSDEVWYRVVQVVTGFEDTQGKTELQVYAARKAIDYLTEKYVDEKLVRLGAYLVGEFGHNIEEEVSGRKQLALLRRHLGSATFSTKALILIACVKVANASPSLTDETKTLLRAYSGTQDLELQTRACELLLLLEEDAAILEKTLAMMPPFSESIQKDNPLVRRLKEDVRRKRDSLRQSDDESGEGGSSSSSGSSSSGSESSHASESASSSASSSKGAESDSEEDQEQDEQQGESEGPLKLPRVSPNDTKGLWKNLCLLPQGYLYRSENLVVAVSQQYRLGEGRMQIKFMNPSECEVTLHKIQIPSSAALAISTLKGGEPNRTVLAPKASFTHRIQLTCFKPFLNPPKYHLDVSVRAPDQNPAEKYRLPFSLPTTIGRFMVPANLSEKEFDKYWEELKEAAPEPLQASAKIPPSQICSYLTKGFKFHARKTSSGIAGAATFHYSKNTEDEQKKDGCVACMCNVDIDGEQITLSVRSAQNLLASSLLQLFAAYFLKTD